MAAGRQREVYRGRARRGGKCCASGLHMEGLICKHSYWWPYSPCTVVSISNPTALMVMSSGSAALRARLYLQPRKQPLCRWRISSHWLEPPASSFGGFGESPSSQLRKCQLGFPNSGWMVASGPWTASPDGSGNSARTEWSSQTRILRYRKRIRLAASVRANCPALNCKDPGDTASLSGFAAPSAHPAGDGRLSRADGLYSSETMPVSRIGL